LSTQTPNNPDAAAEALRASELRYRRLFESAKDGILILDAETGMIVDVNPFLVEMLGFSREAFFDKKVWELGFFKDIIANQANFEELKQREYIRYADMPLETADGRRVDVEFVSNVYLVNQHKVIQCNIRNITERKRMDDERRESQQIIEGILNAIPVRVFWKDKNLVYRGCNTVFARDAGFADAKDIIGKDDYQMGWRNQAELYRNDDRQVIESGCAKLLVQEPQTTPEGNTITLLTSKLPLRGSKGEINGILGTYVDITERMRAEEQIQQIHNRYQGLVEHAREGIFVLDADGCFQLVNAEICNMLGYAREELLGTSILDTYPLDIREDGGHRLARIQTGQSMKFERPMFRKDGSVITIEASAWSTEDGNLQAIVRDITERKLVEEENVKLQAQLQQSQKMEVVGQLAGGVAHDFNNILGAMMMRLHLLQTDLSLEPKQSELVEDFEADIRRAADLTRQLLLFGKRQVMQVKTLDLNDLVENLLKMVRRLIGEQIKLVFEVDAAQSSIEADPGMIEQVVLNLCVNARDAMPTGGDLLIRTQIANIDAHQTQINPEACPGRYACLTVSDQGCGIDGKILQHIFEPFFTTKDVGKGTGLGLSTVHGIVKQHGGWVEVESVVGRGTAFRVYLPASTKTAEPAAVKPQEPLPRGKETILLVEDEDSYRRMMAILIRRQGYTVIEAANGAEAMRQWEAHKDQIDLLFTDMVMPEGMTGMELSEKIRSQKRDMPVVISSGYSIDLLEHANSNLSGFIFISKPCDAHKMMATLHEALGINSSGSCI
jgi:PAS domain S-box-containing protein